MTSRTIPFAALLCAVVACSGTSKPPPPPTPSIDDFLPALPAAGGPALASAGLVTLENRAQRVPAGPAAKGLPGDYFLQNDKIRLLVQAPVRVGEVIGSGGNPINLDFVRAGQPGRTQFGEIAPFFNMAHTASFTRVEVVRDGSGGGPAVIRARGVGSVLDYFNVAGFVDGLGIFQFDTNVPPAMDVAATYILSPGDTHVRVVHTVFNRGDEDLPLVIGSFADTGGDIEPYMPNIGYGEGSYSDIARIIGSSRSIEYWAAQFAEGAYGVVPAPAGVDTAVPNIGLFVAGIAGTLYNARDSLLRAVSEPSLVVPPKQGRSFETYLLMGTDIADVHRQVLQLRGRARGTVSGRVTVAESTTPIAGVRVAALNDRQEPASVATTGADGTYALTLEPGSYTLVADKAGWPRNPNRSATVTAGATATADLTLPPPALLRYTVRDQAGRPLAARITIVGEDPSPPDRRWRADESLARGITRVAHTLHGSSEQDGAIEVEPGTYRVVVSHGNEFSLYDEVKTLVAGANAPLEVTLHRVIDTTGYVAGDFHQHGVNSPDAKVPMRERVISYVAGGVEFVASSDHDYLTDYGPIIRELGVEQEIASMVGVESTPFDYGHFNAFPLPIVPEMPNQGSIDWGDGESTNLSPGRLFLAMRSAGAQVVQVNHPRATNARSSPLSGFQAYFDRAALTFDLDSGRFFGDLEGQPVRNEVLRIASGEPLWSENFDTIEVYNNFSLRDYDGDGEVDDEKVDVVMRDWFNFLSMGKLVTAVGNTDSHTRYSDTVDAPRTYLRVPNDAQPGAVTEQQILDALKVSRDVIVTNGPFLTLHVNGDAQPAIGRVVPATSGRVNLTVKIQAPIWMHLDQVKIFSNNRYRIPPPDPNHDPMSPRLVIPLVPEDPGPGEVLLTRRTLAPGAERWEAEVEIQDFELPDPGKDAWVVALVRGTRGLYPYIPSAVPGSTPIADLVSGAFTGGVFPLAFTNAAFLDRDGNGRYDAPLAR